MRFMMSIDSCSIRSVAWDISSGGYLQGSEAEPAPDLLDVDPCLAQLCRMGMAEAVIAEFIVAQLVLYELCGVLHGPFLHIASVRSGVDQVSSLKWMFSVRLYAVDEQRL